MEKSNGYKRDIRKKNSVLGTGQIILGVAIILLAVLTTWLSIRIVGLVLIVWGISDLSQFLYKQSSDLSGWRFSVGILITAIGLLLVLFPKMGVAGLSLFLAILFIIGGFYKILAALADRPPNWGWVAFGGGLSVILGFFIFSQWPIDKFIILGVLVGIEIIINGWSLLIIEYGVDKIIHSKRIKRTPFKASG